MSLSKGKHLEQNQLDEILHPTEWH